MPVLAWAAPMILEERERLPDPIPAACRARSVAPIVALVAHVHGLRSRDLKGPKRTVAFVKARHTAMWLARRFTGRSLPEIGRAIGDRDHTTVFHACRKLDFVAGVLGEPPEDSAEAWAAFLLSQRWPTYKRD